MLRSKAAARAAACCRHASIVARAPPRRALPNDRNAPPPAAAAAAASLCGRGADRDASLTYGPRTPRYGFEMGHVLLMFLIALAFAVVSPLLLPFSVAWFAFAWVAWRHNLSYVYTRKYESGGLMWIFAFSRVVACLVIGQLFTFCVLVVRGAYWQGFLIVAFLPAITARYYR